MATKAEQQAIIDGRSFRIEKPQHAVMKDRNPSQVASIPPVEPLRLLRLRQVIDKVGLQRSYIYLLESKGQFPQRIKINGLRAVAWVESEIDQYIRERIRLSRQNDACGSSSAKGF